MAQAWTVGLLLYLLNDSENWDLKLCVYKTPFGKSGHNYIGIGIIIALYTYIIIIFST